jgi:hypothetical protein
LDNAVFPFVGFHGEIIGPGLLRQLNAQSNLLR